MNLIYPFWIFKIWHHNRIPKVKLDQTKTVLAYLDPPPEKYSNGIRISNSEIVWKCELSFGHNDVGDGYNPGYWKQNVLMTVWDVGHIFDHFCQ